MKDKTFKKLDRHDHVDMRKVFEMPFKLEPSLTWVQSSCNPPVFNEKNEATFAHCIELKFEKDFD